MTDDDWQRKEISRQMNESVGKWVFKLLNIATIVEAPFVILLVLGFIWPWLGSVLANLIIDWFEWNIKNMVGWYL